MDALLFEVEESSDDSSDARRSKGWQPHVATDCAQGLQSLFEVETHDGWRWLALIRH
jgi:hypothetical protein